jgi:hypothetical protein
VNINIAGTGHPPHKLLLQSYRPEKQRQKQEARKSKRPTDARYEINKHKARNTIWASPLASDLNRKQTIRSMADEKEKKVMNG